MGIIGTDLTGTMATLLMATATTERDLLMPSRLQMLRPNPGGMDTMATLLMAMAIMERGLLRLMPSPGGTDLTGTMATLLMAMATMERGLLMQSQQLMLRPNPGGMETMDTTAIQLMAMATMERDLLMPNLLQTPSLGGTEAMDMAGPMVSIGANLKIN